MMYILLFRTLISVNENIALKFIGHCSYQGKENHLKIPSNLIIDKFQLKRMDDKINYSLNHTYV